MSFGPHRTICRIPLVNKNHGNSNQSIGLIHIMNTIILILHTNHVNYINPSIVQNTNKNIRPSHN